MNSKSKYMEYLPSVFYDTVKDGKVLFTTQYLKIFEKILSGIDDDALNGRKGIAEVLDIIPELFHPRFSFIFDEYLFSWDKIPGNDKGRLIKFLNRHFAIEWVKTAKIEKTDGGRAIKVSNGKNYLSLSLNDEKTKVYLKTDDSRTYEFIAKTENSELNIYFDETSFLHPIGNNNKELFRKYFNTDIDTQEFMNIYVDEFLEWLASWVALVLKEDWDIERKRKVIAGIIPIFRMRGTKKGLEEYLWIYTGNDVNIIEEVDPFQVGIRSTVGENTILGGLPPYFFIVNVDLPASDNMTINNKRKAIKKIIESEKPVHTNYSINIKIEDS